MTMTQLILGCALGFMVAQGIVYGLKRLFGRKKTVVAARPGVAKPARPSYLRTFIRYAAPVGACAAFLMLAAWTIGDYMAGRSAHTVNVEPADTPAEAAVADAQAATGTVAAPDPAPAAVADAEPKAPAAVDPYADADFKVKHHARGALSLKEKIVQHAEQKADSELLRDTQAHAQRSQYDCETADHAQRYLKAGLDVWGFTTWQAKYFPVGSYQGATLEVCQEIKDLVDPSRRNLQASVASDPHP